MISCMTISSLEGTNPNILHNALASVQKAIFRHTPSSSPLTTLFDHTWDYFLKETLLLCTNSRLALLLCQVGFEMS